MKKISITLLSLALSISFFSCSNDENVEAIPDIIIGKWHAIEQYESNTQVEIANCNQYLYTEYYANNSIGGGKTISGSLPVECGVIDFELDWKWKNLGNKQYRFGRLGEQGQISTIYKEDNNLVEIGPNGTTKIVYEPFSN